MKYYAFCTLIVLFFSCQSKTNNTTQSGNDSAVINIEPAITPVSDSAALPLSKEILAAIKIKDYNKLGSYIEDSIRFSPYGYIDAVKDKQFSAGQLLNYLNNNTKLTWGTYDGTGDDISLTATEYFQKFVYDVDFLNAPQISLNKTLSKGNSLNNVSDVYTNAVYTEYYLPGFEKKYEGMDWRSLKLIFKKGNNKLYLIAIVHDQWTI